MEQFEIDERADNVSIKVHMIAGCTSGIIEHFALLPFDNIKTHAQYKMYEKDSYSQIIYKIYNQNKQQNQIKKLSNFYKGGSMVSLGCGPAHAAFFSVHEFNKVLIQNANQQLQPFLYFIGGGLCTIIHDLFMTPFDAIKQRSQLLHNKTNIEIIKNMTQYQGVQSFYRSFGVTLVMNIPFTGLMVMTNETLKPLINNEKDHSFFTYFLCAGFSSLVASIFTMPLDNIKMRLQTQNCISENDQNIIKYQNIKQTVKLIAEEEGMKGFMKGVYPKIASAVPSSAISWATYEILKKLLLNFDQKY